ncbi:MAG: hypothetical protein ABSF83_00550 [Nitrososphaerales archaeon]
MSSVFQTYDNVAHIPRPPDEEYLLMTFFGFLIIALHGEDRKASSDLKEIEKSVGPMRLVNIRRLSDYPRQS